MNLRPPIMLIFIAIYRAGMRENNSGKSAQRMDLIWIWKPIILTQLIYMAKTTIQPRLNIRRDTTNDRYTLVLQIVRERKRSVIFTPYKLLPAEFDPMKGAAVPTSRIREHRRFIQDVNNYLRDHIREVEAVIGWLEHQGKPYTATDVVRSFRKRYDNRCVSTYFDTLIGETERTGNHGTASTYRTTLSAFGKFAAGRRYNFGDLDAVVILCFQKSLLLEGLKNNTITFYLSKLRSVYNKAAREGFAPKGYDPFEGIAMRIEKTRKLAVSDAVLRKVAASKFPGRNELAVARDMFLFSFYTRGMSFVDMAYLRQDDIQGDVIRYRRCKTGQLFTIKIVPELQALIDRYRDFCAPWVLPVMLYLSPEGTYLPYRFEGATPEERQEFERELHKRYKYSRSNFLRLLRRLSRQLELEQSLTFNMARHTWASRARRKGIPMAVISEGLGHTSEKTTRIYLEELEAKRLDEANRIVTSF